MKSDPPPTNISSRRERKRLQTQQNLTETAMKLFSSHGYNNVTMEQIAEAADVAKGTLYNHFPIKEALVASWVHAEIARDHENLLEDVEKLETFTMRMNALLTASNVWCQANREYLPAYLRYRLLDLGGALPATRMHTLDGMGWAFARLIGTAQDRHELRDDLKSEHLAELFAHLYLGALMRWLSGSARDLDAEFETILSLFYDGAACDAQ